MWPPPMCNPPPPPKCAAPPPPPKWTPPPPPPKWTPPPPPKCAPPPPPPKCPPPPPPWPPPPPPPPPPRASASVAIDKLPNATVAATMMTLCRASFFILFPFGRNDVVPVACHESGRPLHVDDIWQPFRRGF